MNIEWFFHRGIDVSAICDVFEPIGESRPVDARQSDVDKRWVSHRCE